jgi:hypothetical protein
MCQPSQAVSPYCNALRKNRQSLPFNAMHRSRKALDKNCQHRLVCLPTSTMDWRSRPCAIIERYCVERGPRTSWSVAPQNNDRKSIEALEAPLTEFGFLSFVRFFDRAVHRANMLFSRQLLRIARCTPWATAYPDALKSDRPDTARIARWHPASGSIDTRLVLPHLELKVGRGSAPDDKRRVACAGRAVLCYQERTMVRRPRRNQRQDAPLNGPRRAAAHGPLSRLSSGADSA